MYVHSLQVTQRILRLQTFRYACLVWVKPPDIDLLHYSLQ